MRKRTRAAALIVAAILLSPPLPAYAAVACNAAEDLDNYYAGDEAAGYRYSGPVTVAILRAAILERWGATKNPAPATEIWITIDLTDGSGAVFMYGADGCHIAHVIAPSMEDLREWMESIGVPAPFGKGYHGLPGAPGNPPGLSI